MEFAGRVDMGALQPSFDMLEKWLTRDRNPVDTAVQPRSRLALDDAATDPHQVSHAVLSALTHAIDHLSCFRTLVVAAEALHIYAPFTLLRAATENIATALWLLQPDERSGRVQRRLWLATANLRREDEVRRLTGRQDVIGIARRLEVIADQGVAAGVPRDVALGSPPGFERIVREAGADTKVGANMLQLVWETCSGITHGQQWATLGLLHREVVGQVDTEGIARLKLTAPEETLVAMVQFVTASCRDAWQLFDQHRLAWKAMPRR